MKFFDPMTGPFEGGREPVDDNQGKNDDESIVSRSGRKRGPKSRFERSEGSFSPKKIATKLSPKRVAQKLSPKMFRGKEEANSNKKKRSEKKAEWIIRLLPRRSFAVV